MRNGLLECYVPIAEAIARLLAPHAEIVLHDLSKGEIFHIAHCFSKRRRGDSSLTDLADLDLSQPVIGPYAKTNWDGQRLKSVSAVIFDRRNKAIGLLCINQNIDAFSRAAEQLASLVSMPVDVPDAATMFPEDWREAINVRIGAFLKQRSVTLAGMSADDLSALIAELNQSGIFQIRHTVNYVAGILDISRATLYQRLQFIRTKALSKSARKGISHVKTKA
jgi:predicted transcriptional regulator YheO